MFTRTPWRLKSQAEKDAIRQWQAAWRARNPDKVKAYNGRSWTKHHPKRLAAKRRLYWSDPEKYRAKSRAYQQANADSRDSQRHGFSRAARETSARNYRKSRAP